MARNLPAQLPLGRLEELRAHQDAERIAYTVRGWDAVIKLYKSRAAMSAFCKPGSAHHALVKDCVHPTLLVNLNMQRRAPYDAADMQA